MAIRNRLLAAAIVVAFPFAAQAQEGIAAGSVTGAVAGAVIAGPVGAVIGAMAGAAVGGTAEEAARRPRGRVTVRPAATVLAKTCVYDRAGRRTCSEQYR